MAITTLTNFITSLRYDLRDYQKGIEFDKKELVDFINRMINISDSQLASLRSEIIHGTENDLDTATSQNYVDLTNLNNSHWDSILSVWIGTDEKVGLTVKDMYNTRKFYTSDGEPSYWAVEGELLLWETGADSAHTDLVIHYNKKTRPRLQSYSDTFTADAATDRITPSSNHPFVTGDGTFQLTTTNTLPAGLSTGTNYYCAYEADQGPGTMQLSTSKTNAIAGNIVDITDGGTGTHTITLTEEMPYNSRYDDLIREMVVAHAKGKKEGELSKVDIYFGELFRKRAMEENLRRNWQPKSYTTDF